MRRIIRWFFIFTFMAIAMQACIQKMNAEQNIKSISDTLTYVVEIPSRSPINQIEFKAIVSQQQVYVVLNVFNDTDQPLALQPLTWELRTREGSRSTPISIHSSDEEIAKGQSAQVEILFEPVHSRKLFHYTGLRGDIDPQYFLEVKTRSANIEKNETIQAQISEDRHQQSVAKYGLVKTTSPYQLSIQKEFVQKQKSYLAAENFQYGKRIEHSVHVADNEILVDGLWLKLQAYLRSDSLYAEIRIVNQSAVTILVDPSAITLIHGSDSIQSVHPYGIQSYKILDGRRANFRLRFPASGTGPFSLDLQSIVFDLENPLPVFCIHILLQKSERDQFF